VPFFNWAPHLEGVLWERRYSSTHSLTTALNGGEWSASRLGPFTPRETASGTHWTGGWVGPRAVRNGTKLHWQETIIPQHSRVLFSVKVFHYFLFRYGILHLLQVIFICLHSVLNIGVFSDKYVLFNPDCVMEVLLLISDLWICVTEYSVCQLIKTPARNLFLDTLLAATICGSFSIREFHCIYLGCETWSLTVRRKQDWGSWRTQCWGEYLNMWGRK
jgi:hypothetical protein